MNNIENANYFVYQFFKKEYSLLYKANKELDLGFAIYGLVKITKADFN